MSETLADLYPLLPWHVEDRYDICDSEGPIGSLSLPEEAAYAVAAANLCNGDLTRIAALLRLSEGIPTEELEKARAMVLSPVKVGDSATISFTQTQGRTVVEISAIATLISPTTGSRNHYDTKSLLLMSAPSLPAAGDEGGEPIKWQPVTDDDLRDVVRQQMGLGNEGCER